MTDRSKLIALFTEFGIGFTVRTAETGSTVRCEESHPKISGCVDFYTDFTFDKNGTFIEMGAWEGAWEGAQE